jgi:hypothetical protein
LAQNRFGEAILDEQPKPNSFIPDPSESCADWVYRFGEFAYKSLRILSLSTGIAVHTPVSMAGPLPRSNLSFNFWVSLGPFFLPHLWISCLSSKLIFPSG